MSDSCDHIDCSLPGSSVHGFSQARIRSGLPFPSLGDVPNPGIEHGSPALQADSLPPEPPGNPSHFLNQLKKLSELKLRMVKAGWKIKHMHPEEKEQGINLI